MNYQFFKIFSPLNHLVDHDMKCELLEKNIHRIIILSLVIVPLSICYILFFTFNLDPESDVKVYNWQLNIIYSHISLGSIYFLLALFASFIKQKKLFSHIIAKLVIPFASFVLVFFGALISSFDQAVTTSITPFLIAVVFIPLLFIQQPIKVAIYLFFGLLFFHLCQTVYQPDVNIAFSNLINVIAICGASYFLSLVVWKSNVIQSYQTSVINKQKEELEHHVVVLKKREAELMVANNNKNRFFSIIAHDLRNPVGSIMSLLNLMTDKEFGRFQSQKELDAALIELQKTANSTFYLLENLLYWSKDQDGKISYNPEFIVLKDLVLNVVSIYSIRLDQKKIVINVNQIDPRLVIYADSNMLKTILRNLISNAIKFSHLYGEIKLTAIKNEESVIIQVEDFGMGIPQDKIGQLFSQNSIFTTAGTYNETGTGLGLLLCQDFMIHHDGTIEVKNKESNGTIFELTFPNRNPKDFI